MMNLRLLFGLLLPLLFSCYHENKPTAVPPEKLLSEQEMIDILTDVQLIEGALTYRRTHRIEQKDFREHAYDQVFTKYGITAHILNENLNYYSTNPGNMEMIYEKVLAKLSRMQGELNEKEKKPASKKD